MTTMMAISGKINRHRTIGVIPKRTLDSLQRYVIAGCEPGGFLKAVLSNDLFNAFALADEHNIRSLGPLVKMIYNDLPADCWGNDKRVEAWMIAAQQTEAAYQSVIGGKKGNGA